MDGSDGARGRNASEEKRKKIRSSADISGSRKKNQRVCVSDGVISCLESKDRTTSSSRPASPTTRDTRRGQEKPAAKSSMITCRADPRILKNRKREAGEKITVPSLPHELKETTGTSSRLLPVILMQDASSGRTWM